LTLTATQKETSRKMEKAAQTGPAPLVQANSLVTSFGVVDHAKGVYRIPVEKAMRLLVEHAVLVADPTARVPGARPTPQPTAAPKAEPAGAPPAKEKAAGPEDQRDPKQQAPQ
jgi:hypothetical protein